MKMSEPELNHFREAAKKAFQAELICALVEDHPHQLTEIEMSEISSLIKKLAGDVYVYMSEVICVLENQK